MPREGHLARQISLHRSGSGCGDRVAYLSSSTADAREPPPDRTLCCRCCPDRARRRSGAGAAWEAAESLATGVVVAERRGPSAGAQSAETRRTRRQTSPERGSPGRKGPEAARARDRDHGGHRPAATASLRRDGRALPPVRGSEGPRGGDGGARGRRGRRRQAADQGPSGRQVADVAVPRGRDSPARRTRAESSESGQVADQHHDVLAEVARGVQLFGRDQAVRGVEEGGRPAPSPRDASTRRDRAGDRFEGSVCDSAHG